MARARTAAETAWEIAFHASALLVKVEGSWTAPALAQFRHFLQLRRLSPSDNELHQFLDRARQAYRAGENHLYLCAAQPCCSQSELETSPAGGRFIALRMDAGYPLADGRKDVHKRWSSSARNPCPAPSSPMLTPTAVSCVKIAWSRASERCNLPTNRRAIASAGSARAKFYSRPSEVSRKD